MLLCGFVFLETAQAQTSTTPTNQRQVGLEFRDLWFGNSVSILMRKPKGDDQYKRRVFTIQGSSNEYDNGLTFSTGVPAPYRSNASANFNFFFEFGKEKRHYFHDDFYGYYGPSFNTNVGFSNQRNSYISSGYAVRRTTESINLGFGVGYLGGLGFDFTDRFSVQVDNSLFARAIVSLHNSKEHSLNLGTLEETSQNTQLDQLLKSFQIPGINNFRIWLCFKI